MGRGGKKANKTLKEGIRQPSKASSRFKRLQKEKLSVFEVKDERSLRAAIDWIYKSNVDSIAIDFETSSNKGFGASNGAIRLIQIGVESEDGPRQIIIDCFEVSPRPLATLLRDQNIEKQIHYLKFEQAWAQLHIGTKINNVYDTRAAWAAIQRVLKDMPEEDVEKALPGYKKHGNKLSDLLKIYMQLEMPKDDQVSDWGRSELHPNQIVYAAMDVVVMPELVEVTKEIAKNLGAEKEVAQQIQRDNDSIKKQIDTQRKRQDDESKRILMALQRCRSRQEVERLEMARRQATVYATNDVRVRQAFEKRKKELS